MQPEDFHKGPGKYFKVLFWCLQLVGGRLYLSDVSEKYVDKLSRGSVEPHKLYLKKVEYVIGKIASLNPKISQITSFVQTSQLLQYTLHS